MARTSFGALATLATAQLKHERRRFALSGAGLLLAIFFLTLILLLNQSLNDTVRGSIAEPLQRADAVVSAPKDFDPNAEQGKESLTQQQLDSLAKNPSVASSWPQYTTFESVSFGSDTTRMVKRVNYPADSSFFPWSIDGKAPKASNEVVIDSTLAAEFDLQVGDRFPMTDFDTYTPSNPEDTQPAKPKDSERTVVGIFTTTVSGGMSVPLIYQGGTELQSYLPLISSPGPEHSQLSGARTALVKLKDPAQGIPAELASSLGSDGTGALPVVNSAEDYTNHEVQKSTGGANSPLYFLLIFGGIALTMACFVISSTFEMVAAQRISQLALLRTLGASRTKVFALMLGESVLFGMLFSAFAVLLAYPVAAFVFPSLLGFAFHISLLPGMIGLAVGVLLTTVINLFPTLRVFNTTPLQMFAHSSSTAGERSISKPFLWGALFLVIVGACATAYGINAARGFIIVGGCFALTVGISLLFPLCVHRLAGLIARRFSPYSATGLALSHAQHAPKRTATSSRMIFISTLLVGAVAMGYATTQSTLNYAIDEWQPIPLVANLDEATTGSPSLHDINQRVQNVKELNGVASAQLAVPAGEFTPGEGLQTTAYSVDFAELTHNVSILQDEPLADDTLLISTRQAKELGLVNQQRIDVVGSDKTVSVQVHTVTAQLPQAYISEKLKPELGESDLAAQSTQGYAPTVLITNEPGLSNTAISTLQSEISSELGVSQDALGGGLIEKNYLQQTLDRVLIACFVLLAATLLISMVGVANTIQLGALQRARDNALLRTLGVSRTTLQHVISREVVLVALLAAIGGTISGVIICALGMQILAAEDLQLHYVLPWAPMLAVLGLAVFLAWLAAFLPARRASKIPPVRAFGQV